MRAEWLNKDFYGILGVDPASSSEQIKRAYRTRQRSTHPDLHADDPTAEPLTKSLNEANAVLSDPASRKEYDQHLREVAQAVRGDPNQSADPPPPPQPGQDQDAPPWPDHAERGSDFRWTAQTPGTGVALGGLWSLGSATARTAMDAGSACLKVRSSTALPATGRASRSNPQASQLPSPRGWPTGRRSATQGWVAGRERADRAGISTFAMLLCPTPRPHFLQIPGRRARNRPQEGDLGGPRLPRWARSLLRW